MDSSPAAVLEFARIVEEADLHGLPFQHLALCERRAWLHLQRIDCAHLDERMALGAAAHEISRPRDSSTEGLIGLAPDRIDWGSRIVIEAKGGAGAKDAVSRQTAFYALLLWAATGRPWRAHTEILPQKRAREVEINPALIDEMLEMARALARLRRRPDPPPAARKPICDACSYRFLCGWA